MNIAKSNSIVPGNIVRIIDAKGIKQNVVANKAGYEKQAFSAMLNGRRIIRVADIITIATALEVQPNELFRQLDDEAEEK